MNLAIVNSKKTKYSETFIRKHLDLLPFKKFHYYGYYPQFLNDDTNRINTGLEKILNRIVGKLQGKDYWDYQKALVRSWEHNKIQVILVEYGTVAMRILPALKLSKIPFIVHFHGYDMSVKSYLERYENYRELWDYASYFIVVSNSMLEKARVLGFPMKKVKLNPYGPDDKFFEIHPDYTSNNFLCVGRFTEKKAPHLTIQAFKRVYDLHPEVTLKMVGDGELLEKCKVLVNQYRLNDQIEFLGIRSPDEIMQLMVDSKAFVQHSIVARNGDMEGTPLSILEAQAAGLPVVSTRHAGICDVVVEGKTGLLCNEHDVDQMAQSMIKLLETPDLASSMGRASKEHIHKNFTLEMHLDRLKNTILSLV